MKYVSNENLRDFIKEYGVDAQIEMAIEECAELIIALRHFNRTKVNADDVMSEIADVIIMMEQLATIFVPNSSKSDIGILSEQTLMDEINLKINRQLKRLKDHKKKDKPRSTIWPFRSWWKGEWE